MTKRSELIKLLERAQELAFDHDPALCADIQQALANDKPPKLDWLDCKRGFSGRFSVSIRPFGHQYTYQVHTCDVANSIEEAQAKAEGDLNSLRERA